MSGVPGAPSGTPPRVILASGSKARREMLAGAGVEFSVRTADVDEPVLRAAMRGERGDAVAPADVALMLARAKAEAVSRLEPGAIVIGSDQVLALDGALLSKPGEVARVSEQIVALAGRTHELVSAVAIAIDGAMVWSAVDAARLTMRAVSDRFVEVYVAACGEEVRHSVGAYHLEGLGVQLFEKIEGDYFTILGMPLLPLLAELRRRGVLMA